MRNDRRSFLKLAASATALSVLPPNLRAVLANPRPGKTGTIKDVEHVVIFMQENRSFDHYFGTLRGVRGFNDPRAITLPSGKSVWQQPNGKDEVTPFHMDTAKTNAQFLHSLDHSWKRSHDLWKNHDVWIPAKTDMTMGYFTRADIPFYHALADTFTICDAYHCSVFGPTNPNRLFLFTGTSGLTVGSDGLNAVENPADETNETADPAKDAAPFKPLEWTTYAERLDAAGIDWRVYQEYDNFGDNGLAYFKQFRGDALSPEMHIRARAHVDGSDAANAKESRGEHLVAAFAKDVAEDRLPHVSWIVAPTAMSEHPYAPPSYGESLTSRLLDALAANPKVWARTVFILNYDENDGFFDHVPPPVPPLTHDIGASTVDMTGESYQGVPFGFGPRVPAIVVSPWTVGGYVNSELFDHTSVLRFLEARFGVQEPNISAWRRAVTGDLTSAFDFAQSNSAALPNGSDGVARADATLKFPQVVRSTDGGLPRQEPGHRPARPLPYDFEITGKCLADGFTLAFDNRGRAGAAFRVSSTQDSGPWFFTVEAGKTLSYTLPRNGRYDFSLQGPNGFFRRFAGDGSEMLEIDLQFDKASGELCGEARNSSAVQATLVMRDGYTPGSTTSLDLKSGGSVPLRAAIAQNANWYDIRFETTGGYVRHFGGHIETGAPSMSDPLLS
ncbi:MAG TPA: phospholipase C, phosphocholine-specific [Rhizomicrobium sp.]|nr:phospholipase C, phosphocholine-specific [Rhizomicrobium sp.]